MKRYKYDILSGITGSTFQVPIFLEASVDEMGVMVGFDGEFEQIEQYANFTYKSAYGWAAYGYFPGAFGSNSLACSSGVPAISTFYLNEQYSQPTAGQYVYTNKALTTIFNGSYGYFRMQREDGQWFAAQIAPWGMMLSVLKCTPYVSPTPSPTPSETPCPVNPSPTPSPECELGAAIVQITECPVTPTPTPSVTQTPCDIDCDLAMTVVEVPCPSVTPSVTPSITPTVTPTSTPSVTPSRTPSSTPPVSPSSTPAVTPSRTPSVTPTRTPSVTPTRTPSVTPSGGPGSIQVITSNFSTEGTNINNVTLAGQDVLVSALFPPSSNGPAGVWATRGASQTLIISFSGSEPSSNVLTVYFDGSPSYYWCGTASGIQMQINGINTLPYGLMEIYLDDDVC